MHLFGDEATREVPDSRRTRRNSSKRTVGGLAGLALALVLLLALANQHAVAPLGPRGAGSGGMNVTTYHNDNARTGQNLQETVLTPLNVNVNSFGKLFSVPVDGWVYAQPLILTGVSIPHQGVHNVAYVATEHDSVYALDADNGRQLWFTSFIDPDQGITTVNTSTDIACGDLVPEVGITSTPVIDIPSNTIYVVARTRENGNFFQRLHALDVATGQERKNSPVTIHATVAGTGDGSVEGRISFNALTQHNRTALLLQNGLVEIGWASHCDIGPYHGWLMAYDAHSLKQAAVWNATPGGGTGGIWQSGAGPAGDGEDNTFFATGNGTFDPQQQDWGDTIVKLAKPSRYSMNVADFFTPDDQAELNNGDVDLGSGGVLLLPDQPPGAPHQHLLVQSGKQGTIYLVDRDDMGHFNPNNNNQIVQSIPNAMGGAWGMPAWWNNRIYYGGSGDVMKQFSFDPSTGLLSAGPVTSSQRAFGFRGSTPSVSANDRTNGIVWAVDTTAYGVYGPETLVAYDATDLANELYNSAQIKGRDTAGEAVKFVVPTVANGKVYVGSVKQVSVYGLLK